MYIDGHGSTRRRATGSTPPIRRPVRCWRRSRGQGATTSTSPSPPLGVPSTTAAGGARSPSATAPAILLRMAELVRASSASSPSSRCATAASRSPTPMADIDEVAFMFEYYAGWATKISGDIPPVGPDAMSLVVKEPVGVCGLIVPWNYPMLMAAQKVAPALAAGCTVVLKPAEQTPLTALRLAAIAEEAGSRRRRQRRHRVRCRRPGRHCSPTRRRQDLLHRVEGGRPLIQRTCADQLKRVTLELGGKSPNIVFADAALDRAVPGTSTRRLRQPGRGVLGREPGLRRALGLRRRARGA
jgi:hypothetical protein